MFVKALAPLWAYRGFIMGSVKREFQSKYRNSLLGVLWTVINPMSMIFVYTIIFSQVMRSRLPGATSVFSYSIYLCAGMLTWNMFSEIVLRSQNVFFENANILKKISFPRLCLPVIVVCNAGINFAIVFGLFTLFLIFSGNFPGLVFLALIPVIALQIFFAISLGILLGVVNVFFRDVEQFFIVSLQFWFWFTPIAYPRSILPAAIDRLLVLNPMAALVTTYQNILVSRQWPDWASLMPVAVLSVALCLLGLRMFRSHLSELMDEL